MYDAETENLNFATNNIIKVLTCYLIKYNTQLRLHNRHSPLYRNTNNFKTRILKFQCTDVYLMYLHIYRYRKCARRKPAYSTPEARYPWARRAKQ